MSWRSRDAVSFKVESLIRGVDGHGGGFVRYVERASAMTTMTYVLKHTKRTYGSTTLECVQMAPSVTTQLSHDVPPAGYQPLP